MVNLNAAGTLGKTFEVRIESGKIEEFVRSLDGDVALHAGHEAISPPTFLTVQNFYEEWAPDGANPWKVLDFDPEREMHAEQEFVFHGPPPRAGAVLSAQSRIESIARRSEGSTASPIFAVMITEYRDAVGELVAEAVCTGVEIPETSEEQK